MNYKFPITSIISGKDQNVRNLKFQYAWLVLFFWLSYSGIQDGAFCKFCESFSKSHGGHDSQLLGSLVLKKCNNWKRVVEIFTKHSTLQYHQKRKNVLSHKILDSSNGTTKKTLKRCCATRWIERYHAVHDLLELFGFIVEPFSEISERNDNDTIGKAQRLQKSILDGEFIISLLIHINTI